MKNNKKGFTLAELLIVVAIIAVLVAIAVPLFIGGLKQAEKARNDANERAVKSAAVVYILNQPTTTETLYSDGVLFTHFAVDATVTADGQIKLNKVQGAATEADALKFGESAGKTKGVTPSGSDWTVITTLTSSDLTALAS